MKRLLLILSFFPLTLMAQQVPLPEPGTYVNDKAGVLSSTQKDQLNMEVARLEKETSVQLAIILVNNLPDNTVIEDYAREIGRQWGVGRAGNGLVYVAAINQRKQRLEVAKNLEGTIPDITALHIITQLKPFFRQSDYFGGLFFMVGQIRETVKPAAAEQKALVTEAEAAKHEDVRLPLWFIVLMGLVSGLSIIFSIRYLVRRKGRLMEQQLEDDKIKTRQNIENLVSMSRSRDDFRNQVLNTPVSPYVRRNDDIDDPPRSSSGHSSPSRSDDSPSFGGWGGSGGDSSPSPSFDGGGATSDW